MPHRLPAYAIIGLAYAEFAAFLVIVALSVWIGRIISDDAGFSIITIFGIVGLAFGALFALEHPKNGNASRKVIG